MATVGSVLLWTLLGLLGLLILLLLLLLFLPFDLHVRARANLVGADWEDGLQGTARGQVRLRWGVIALSGWAAWKDGSLESSGVRLLGRPLGGSRRPRGKTPRRHRPPKRSHQQPRGMRRRPGVDPALIWPLIQEALGLPGRFWRSLGVRLRGELTYGFSDPSLTGLCEAVRWGTGRNLPIHLTPDFRQPCLVGWAETDGRLYGFRLAAIAWRVLRNPRIWNPLVGKIRFRPLRTILLQGGS